MEKKDMVEMLINHYSDGNKAQFAAKVGIKPQALSMWLSRNSFDAEAIYASCEGVSAKWLLSCGEAGDMIENSQDVNISSEINEELIRLRAENDILRELAGLRKKTGTVAV